MHILITGGFGFIGSYLTRHYLESGHFVSVIDNLSTSTLTQVSEIVDTKHPHLKFYEIDLAFPSADDLLVIEKLVAESDIVFHMASSVGVRYIDHNPEKSIQNNLFMNVNLFPLLEKHQKKMIYGSTSEVYGESELARESDHLKIGPPDVLRWGYSCTKLMGEFLLKSYTFPHVIARFFNVTGKGQSSEHGMVLPSFIKSIKNNEPLVIYDEGTQKRSFCDVRDAVNMLAALAAENTYNGNIFNIGNSLGTVTIRNLAELVLEIANKELPIKHESFEKSFKHSKEIFSRTPDTSKILAIYKPQFSLSDTISEMLK